MTIEEAVAKLRDKYPQKEIMVRDCGTYSDHLTITVFGVGDESGNDIADIVDRLVNREKKYGKT